MGQRDTMKQEYFNGPMYDINQRQRAMSQNNQSRKTVQDPLYDDHSAFSQKLSQGMELISKIYG